MTASIEHTTLFEQPHRKKLGCPLVMINNLHTQSADTLRIVAKTDWIERAIALQLIKDRKLHEQWGYPFWGNYCEGEFSRQSNTVYQWIRYADMGKRVLELTGWYLNHWTHARLLSTYQYTKYAPDKGKPLTDEQLKSVIRWAQQLSMDKHDITRETYSIEKRHLETAFNLLNAHEDVVWVANNKKVQYPDMIDIMERQRANDTDSWDEMCRTGGVTNVTTETHAKLSGKPATMEAAIKSKAKAYLDIERESKTHRFEVRHKGQMLDVFAALRQLDRSKNYRITVTEI